MKQKFDTIDNAHRTVREDCVDIEIAVEKLVEDKLTPEEKKNCRLRFLLRLPTSCFLYGSFSTKLRSTGIWLIKDAGDK